MGRVLIAKRDLFARELVRQTVAGTLGREAEIVTCGTAHDALAVMRERPAVLGIFGLSFSDRDGLDLLEEAGVDQLVWRSLVVSSRGDERAMTRLRQLRVPRYPCGMTLDSGRFHDALLHAAAGVRVSLAGEIETADRVATPTLDQLMTEHEQLIFSVLGDGCDDDAAAEILSSCANTVRWHRHRIMGKLGVKSRGEMVREAVRRGVVRFSGDLVLHPGFERSLAALRTRLPRFPAAAV